MSYLFPLGSNAQLGVVQVGSNISVDGNSIISIAQDVGTTANITFNNITVNTLSSAGNLSAGNITTTGTANIATLNVTSEIVTGNIGVGNVNATGNVYSNGRQTVTNVTPTPGNGISIGNLTSSGPSASFTVTNTGVLNLSAGTGISLSSNTGNITISATRTSIINTTGQGTNYTITAADEYVGLTGSGSTIVTLPIGVTGTLYYIKNEKTNASKVTVVPTGIDTIDGANTKELTQNASITVVYRAGAWRII